MYCAPCSSNYCFPDCDDWAEIYHLIFDSAIGDYHKVGLREKWEKFIENIKMLEEISGPVGKVAEWRMKGGFGGLGEALVGRVEVSRECVVLEVDYIDGLARSAGQRGGVQEAGVEDAARARGDRQLVILGVSIILMNGMGVCMIQGRVLAVSVVEWRCPCPK